VPAALADAFRDGRLAGVFLRRGNLESVEQARALCAEIQSFAGGGLPWIVAIDEEGGLVSHLAHLLPAPPAPMAIAAAGARARDVGRRAGRALRGLGINTVFAPVADVNTERTNPVIGSRSFGDEPERVSRLVAEMLQGYRDAGVLATVKHFPGHGMTAADSHTALPVVDLDEAQMAAHLRPFRTAALADADLVMTAHVAYPALEAAVAVRAKETAPKAVRPATLSSLLLRHLLRHEMSFSGLVVSDAFEMTGLAKSGTALDVVERGTLAGVDLWLLAQGLESLEAVDRGIARVARDGGGRFLVQQSGARVNDVRMKIGVAAIRTEPAGEDAALLYEEVAARALCVLRGAERFPFVAKRPLFLLPEGWPPHLVLDRALAEREIRERWPGATVRWVDSKWDSAAMSAPMGADADAIVVATSSRGPMLPAVRAMLEAADATGKPLTAVAMLDPYDAAEFPERAAAVATFGARPENLRALFAFLASGEGGGGRLPVRL
jgi:beta-N-acetylhexosaminidase